MKVFFWMTFCLASSAFGIQLSIEELKWGTHISPTLVEVVKDKNLKVQSGQGGRQIFVRDINEGEYKLLEAELYQLILNPDLVKKQKCKTVSLKVKIPAAFETTEICSSDRKAYHRVVAIRSQLLKGARSLRLKKK